MRQTIRVAVVLAVFGSWVGILVDVMQMTPGWTGRDTCVAIVTVVALWMATAAIFMVFEETE